MFLSFCYHLEINAVKNLSGLRVKFHLLDHSVKTIDVHPADTASDALVCLAQRIGLKNVDGWALFEVNTTTNIERYVRNHHYIADYLAKWEKEAKDAANEKENSIYGTVIHYGTLGAINKNNSTKNSELQFSYKFILRKRLFKKADKTSLDPLDTIQNNLLYAQAVNSVVNRDDFNVTEGM